MKNNQWLFPNSFTQGFIDRCEELGIHEKRVEIIDNIYENNELLKRDD